MINIFLPDVEYNADLRNHFALQRVRTWLEVPLDSHTAMGLRGEPEGPPLPRWPGVRRLTPQVSKAYQNVASGVAQRTGVCRVDLDMYYWRAGRHEEPASRSMGVLT